MSQHKESDFIIPFIITVYQLGGKCSMEQIKNEICKYIKLSPEDWKPYPSRSKHEPRYRQVVGNLVSHRTQDLFKYIYQIIPDEELYSDNPKYLYYINESGRDLVESLPKDKNGFPSCEGVVLVDGELSFKEAYSVIENEANDEIIKEEIKDEMPLIEASDQDKTTILDERDSKVVSSVKGPKIKRTDITKADLTTTIVRVQNYQCQYARLKGKKHITFKKEDGTQYAIGHHLIPMSASVDFFPKNLDRASNIVTLCPNCHDAVHYGSIDEKKEILQVLYENMIDQLNDEGIFISFEKLIEKYYWLESYKNGK